MTDPTGNNGTLRTNAPFSGTAVAVSVPPQQGQFVLAAARRTTWQPGVTYNTFPNTGLVGIPNRTSIAATLSPLDVSPGRTINISIASPAVITMSGGGAHGMNVNDPFWLYTTGSLPTGVSGLAPGSYLTAANTTYYVISAGFSTTQFQFSTSIGGAAVGTSGTQSGTQTMIRSDAPQINAAVVAATAEQVVKLNAGIFNIDVNGIILRNNNVTLRGAGPGVGLNTAINPVSMTTTWIPGTMVADAAATQLYRVDRNIGAGANPLVKIGGANALALSAPVALTADAVKGTFTCQLASVPGALTVGVLVLIDINTSGTQGAFGDVRDCNMSIANPGAIHQNNHGLAANTQFKLTGTSIDGTYFVLATGLATSSFQFSTSAGGAAVNTAGVTFNTMPRIAVAGTLYTTIPANPDVDWGINMGPPGDPTRATWQNNTDRSIGQVMKVSAINGTTITFETPFHYTMATKYVAQLYTFTDTPIVVGIGLEELFCYSGTNGTIGMGLAHYCWAKHVETAWSYGAGIAMTCCYRCEVRDSYFHDAPTPHPNSGAYVASIVTRSSDCLFENNITWRGDKVITMQAAGGGNVLGYNYMDDAFIDSFCQSPEAGINCGHNTTTPFCLMEGNYSHQFTADSFWGSAIYTTCLRNQFSAHRAGAHGLSSYVYTLQSPNLPYGDYEKRLGVHVQSGSYNSNFVGNIIGLQGQTLLAANFGEVAQTTWVYEQFNTLFADSSTVVMWYFGEIQGSALLSGENAYIIDPLTINTQLRQGNWDWFTQSQHWYANIGDTGSSTGSAMVLPNSYYLTSKPAFLNNHPWPSGDPSTGSFANQAQARFNSSNPNDLTV